MPSSINNLFFSGRHYLIEFYWTFYNKIRTYEITFVLFPEVAADQKDRINNGRYGNFLPYLNGI